MQNHLEEIVVSVIVPVYNAEKHLSQCITSILEQSYPNFYLLLIDDGSTDSSGSICDDFALLDSRIKVFHIANGGPGAARNFGLKEVSTEWVCFVDSDDVIEKKYLASFFKDDILQKDCLVIQGLEYVDSTGNKKLNCNSFPDNYFANDNVESGISKYRLLHFGGPIAKLYNMEIIKNYHITFNTSIRFHEDHIFYLQYLYYVKSIRLVSQTLYKYRQNEGSLTHSVHPYEQIETAYQLFAEKLELVIDKFQISDINYLDEIRHDATRIHIKAIRFCYQSMPNKSMRLKFLHSCLDKKNDIRKNYHPNSVNEQIWKFILLYLPIPLQDRLLSILIKKI